MRSHPGRCLAPPYPRSLSPSELTPLLRLGRFTPQGMVSASFTLSTIASKRPAKCNVAQHQTRDLKYEDQSNGPGISTQCLRVQYLSRRQPGRVWLGSDIPRGFFCGKSSSSSNSRVSGTKRQNLQTRGDHLRLSRRTCSPRLTLSKLQPLKNPAHA